MSPIYDELLKFSPISLDEATSAQLMIRSDLKFAIKASLLPQILERITPNYQVLEIAKCRQFTYRNTYFDTADFQCYYDHYYGRIDRYKLRLREYVENKEVFAEIKRKKENGLTHKQRIPVSGLFDPNVSRFYKTSTELSFSLFHAKMHSTFKRVTLVSLCSGERVTIDTDMHFFLDDQEFDLPGLSLIELKYEVKEKAVGLLPVLAQMGLSPMPFSKYCVAAAILYPNLRCEMFLPIFNRLNEICNDCSAFTHLIGNRERPE